MPQKGEGERAGREVLWPSALHVVGDEEKDKEEDEDHLEGDALPEEAQHGGMVGSAQVELKGHH